MTPTLLIDADFLVYKFAYGEHEVFDWGDGVVSEVLNEEEAKAGVRAYVMWLAETLGTGRMVLALSDNESNFRKDIYPEYKANRKERPPLYAPIRQWMIDTYRPYIRPGLEADDVVGILATNRRIIPGPKIVVSIDKDARCVPCMLFDPSHPNDPPHLISVFEADWFHLYQTLMGDRVDNYPGCPGIGPVKARRLLNSVNANDPALMWKTVVETYESRGLTADDALRNARLARILRASDYDFANKRPKLWEPPAL